MINYDIEMIQSRKSFFIYFDKYYFHLQWNLTKEEFFFQPYSNNYWILKLVFIFYLSLNDFSGANWSFAVSNNYNRKSTNLHTIDDVGKDIETAFMTFRIRTWIIAYQILPVPHGYWRGVEYVYRHLQRKWYSLF